jgi:hypothetical protein
MLFLLKYCLATILILSLVIPARGVMIQGRVETHVGHRVYKLNAHKRPHRKHRKRRIILKMQYAKLETRSAYELTAIREHWRGWIGIIYNPGSNIVTYIYPCSNIASLGVEEGDQILTEDGHPFSNIYGGPNPNWIPGQRVKLKVKKRSGLIFTIVVTLVRY